MNASFPGFEDDEPKPPKSAGSSAAKPAAGPAKPPPSPAATPSFEFEDEEPKKPAAPAAKTPAAAAFNPFDQPVSVPIGGTGTGVAMEPPPPVARKSTATATPSKGNAVGSPPAAEPEEEIELRPGRAAKDLWICPHCSTGNKPGRAQCRTCGKSPDDPVIIPWFQQPKILGGIGGGVAVLLALMIFTGGADLSMAAPGPEHLDAKAARIGGSPNTPGVVDLGEQRSFAPRHQLAVSGRVVMCQPHVPADWLTVVILALGKDAANDESIGSMSADWGSGEYQIQGLLPTVTLYFINDGRKHDYAKGSYLSIVGDTGDLEEGGKIVEGTRASGAHVVRVRLEQAH